MYVNSHITEGVLLLFLNFISSLLSTPEKLVLIPSLPYILVMAGENFFCENS